MANGRRDDWSGRGVGKRERVELNKLLLNTRLLIREDKRLVYIAGCQFVTMATKNKLVGGVHIIIANNLFVNVR